MKEPPKKPNSPNPRNSTTQPQSNRGENSNSAASQNQPPLEITKRMIEKINGLVSLQAYPIRDLVKHAEEFGPYLKQQRLETNQVRKFLDAVNRLKVDLAQGNNDFAKIDTEMVLLKPKLAYAAARQRSAKPLSDVMSVAIDKVESTEDFIRLVQLIESIIAYHKAEGGR